MTFFVIAQPRELGAGKTYLVYKVTVSSFIITSLELVPRWNLYKNRKESFVSETFIMSQDCFLNSKDGKNYGSSRGLSGLVRLAECNDEVKPPV